jgi:excisionase family DNA binding protein
MRRQRRLSPKGESPVRRMRPKVQSDDITNNPVEREAGMTARPYSPQTLADRWGCSSEKVRQMCRNGELASFTLGKLIRIPAHEVERVECQTSIASDHTEESSSSSTPMPLDSAFAARLARQTGASQKLALVNTGQQSPQRRQNG